MRDLRNIAVIGVTGYTGFELATLLLRHPGIGKAELLCAGDQRGALPFGDVSPVARMGRGFPEAALA